MLGLGDIGNLKLGLDLPAAAWLQMLTHTSLINLMTIILVILLVTNSICSHQDNIIEHHYYKIL